MALAFQHRSGSAGNGSRIALFPGAWNPPTVAHRAIARAAREYASEVIWLLPRAFPHKGFEGADFDQRLDLLCRIARAEAGFSVAVTEGGLYCDMAGEARAGLGPEPEIALLCGRDAAERIAGWDYGRPGVFDEMVDCYPLLVAGRAGGYLPHARHAGRVIPLDMGSAFDEVSSTEVRRRIETGLEWRHLVPEEIAEAVGRIFSAKLNL
jgi:nicotinic acid mononucleotide adenylyltransferase